MTSGPGDEHEIAPLDPIRPEHAAYVRRLVSRCGNLEAPDREDVTQEVLLQAHRSRASPLPPRALLAGITRHVVAGWMRARGRERATVRALESSHVDGGQPSPEEQHEAAERARVVHEAIAELPPMFREVFERCEIEEQTVADVARAQGILANTAYTRLHLARVRFRTAVVRRGRRL